MGDIKEERRKSIRIKKALVVRYSYTANKEKKKWDITTIRDINETGISIITIQSFLTNDTLNFFIKIPSRPLEWVEFTGRVVSCESAKSFFEGSQTSAYVTRIEFISLKEGEKKIIQEYIAWFLSKSRQ